MYIHPSNAGRDILIVALQAILVARRVAAARRPGNHAAELDAKLSEGGAEATLVHG